MSRSARHTLVIQRTICCIVAAVGAIVVWASVAHAAVIGTPAFQDVSTKPIAMAVMPEPATLVMLTCGIMCVASKLRRGGN